MKGVHLTSKMSNKIHKARIGSPTWTLCGKSILEENIILDTDITLGKEKEDCKRCFK